MSCNMDLFPSTAACRGANRTHSNRSTRWLHMSHVVSFFLTRPPHPHLLCLSLPCQSMVNEQQANIDLIDGSIYQAKEKTELAHKELLEAEEYQKKSRKKKCCVLFLILAVIAVIVIVVTIAK